VILPPARKARGRPKGICQTVIGIPKKKQTTSKPTPFMKKAPVEKEKS